MGKKERIDRLQKFKLELEEKKKQKECYKCNGTGFLYERSDSWECPVCKGDGENRIKN